MRIELSKNNVVIVTWNYITYYGYVNKDKTDVPFVTSDHARMKEYIEKTPGMIDMDFNVSLEKSATIRSAIMDKFCEV